MNTMTLLLLMMMMGRGGGGMSTMLMILMLMGGFGGTSGATQTTQGTQTVALSTDRLMPLMMARTAGAKMFALLPALAPALAASIPPMVAALGVQAMNSSGRRRSRTRYIYRRSYSRRRRY